jgi:DNA-binding HxlR family transcriptional regulator
MVVMAAADRSPGTALAAALDRVGDRWSLLVVDALLPGPRRFGDLLDALAGIAPNILTDRLRRLEREGIVVTTAYSRRPPRMDYALTADGQDPECSGAGSRARAHSPRCVRNAARGPLVLPDLCPGRRRG